MAQLIYGAILSLDGYISDESGNFDWSEPDEEVHQAANDLQATIGTHLYGRRLFEVMRAWETWDVADEPPVIQEYASLWRNADKVVYSRTLEHTDTARTELRREFDAGEVARLKTTADSDLLVGGAGLAGLALRAGLVDELQLFVSPVVVGGGTRFLPDGLRLALSLTEHRRFGNGVVFTRCRVVN